MLDEHQVPQVLEQVDHEPPEILPLLGELLDERERAGGVVVDDQVADPVERLLLDRPEQLQHGLHVDLALGRGGELVEGRDRVAERAARGAGDQRERLVGRLDPLAVGDAAQHACTRSGSRGRANTNVWQRERTVGSTLPSSVVQKTKRRWGGGSSIDLQQRVPRRVGELVRLVEDVDLVLPLDRLQHDALADLADVVDPALRRGVHLDHVERGAVRDRDAGVAGLVGRRRRARARS